MASYGWALEYVKCGGRAQRRDWRDMFVYHEGCALPHTLDERHPLVADGRITYEPALVLRTAQGTHQIGWLASQADMLAEDWTEA